MIPTCPDALPDNITGLLRDLGRHWAESVICPHVGRETLARWDELLAAWADDDALPLLVRKSGLVRGSEVRHSSGRQIVPTDNSPAQWARHLDLRHIVPSIQEIRQCLLDDTVPMSFAHMKGEQEKRRYHCTLGKYSINKAGWQLCHIEDVGLNSRTPLEVTAIEDLKTAFRNLMSPGNFFLVPKVWGGMGDTHEFVEAFRDAAPNQAT